MDYDRLWLIADTDQDRAALEQWWRSHDDEAKLMVWEVIQKIYDDPCMEVMSRFAQVAFSEAALRFSKGT